LIYLVKNTHLLQDKTQEVAKVQLEETPCYQDLTTTDLITILALREAQDLLNIDISRARNNFCAHYLKMQQVILKISILLIKKSKKKLKHKMKQKNRPSFNYNNIEIII
jgi:hypothetical protein